MEQQQGGGRTINMPGWSKTITDLSEGQRWRRASHPNMTEPCRFQSSSTLGPRSRACFPSNCHPTSPPNTDRNSHHNNREDDSLSKSPGSASSGPSDCKGFQTLGNHTSNPKGSSISFYSTLAAPPCSPRSPPSPRTRISSQKSVRNQLLRARACRLARERSEVTTDEEVRGGGDEGGEEEGGQGQCAGRYCSRTERRRHLVSSRQHRERRGGGEAGGGQGSLSSQTVLELSHMKQNRLRNSKLLDDWTTVEELLTHGTRVESDSQLCPSPLLSVTTV